jgi:hypothetical protein
MELRTFSTITKIATAIGAIPLLAAIAALARGYCSGLSGGLVLAGSLTWLLLVAIFATLGSIDQRLAQIARAGDIGKGKRGRKTKEGNVG